MFKKYKIGEILKQDKVATQILPNEKYCQLTVKMNHKGVVRRGTILGREVGSKQYEANSGKFIISRIDARNGAAGLIPSHLKKAIVTNDFPIFSINDEIVFPKYFEFLSSTKVFDNICRMASEGTIMDWVF